MDERWRASASGSSGTDDAARYKSAVASLDHVDRVESSSQNNAGMGRTADLFIYADTSDSSVMLDLLDEALSAVLEASSDDPEVSLAIQVISSDGSTAVSPADLGYSGTGSLSSLREFFGG